MASAAGTASATPIVAAANASRTESQNADTMSPFSRIARNQRSDAPSNGIEMKPLSVNATSITTTSGARMKERNNALNNRPQNPFCFMVSLENVLETAFGETAATHHDRDVRNQQEHRDACAERPVQRAEEFVVGSRRDDFQTAPADQRRRRECRRRQREHDDRSGQHAG